MKGGRRKGRAWLLANAKAVAHMLKPRSEGTRLVIRIPGRTAVTNTDGWWAVIGNLGVNQPRLEIWFDRFSGYEDRKLYACFRSKERRQIIGITRRVSRKLWPVRTVIQDDIADSSNVTLNRRLQRSEFHVPIMEKYANGWTFYGIYDLTRQLSAHVSPNFCSRALAFFEDVARALPHSVDEDEHREVFPQYENRKRVASHLQRERSRLLAAECKIRDKYRCQICGLRFEIVYGELGIGFAEAHHLVPLNQLRGQTKTRIEELRSVCANCHRMLHRMEGKRGDFKRLREIVRVRKRRKS